MWDAREDTQIPALRRHRPEDAILSEESEDTAARLSASRVWIIDPVDGTREFAEGREDWAIHVGLAVDGEAHAGAVALPALDLVLTSAPQARPAHPDLGQAGRQSDHPSRRQPGADA